MNKDTEIHDILLKLLDLNNKILDLISQYDDVKGCDSHSREAIEDVASKRDSIAQTLKKGGVENDLQKSKELLNAGQWANRVYDSPLLQLIINILKLENLF